MTSYSDAELGVAIRSKLSHRDLYPGIHYEKNAFIGLPRHNLSGLWWGVSELIFIQLVFLVE